MNKPIKINLAGFEQRTRAAVLRDVRAKGIKIASLLGNPESNPKTKKNKKDLVITYPLNLAPADESGFEVCPKRTAGCTLACLNTAGNPLYLPAKLNARIQRTLLFFLHRELFYELLRIEIDAAFKKVEKMNLENPLKQFSAGFRLNCTSDLNYERLGRGSNAFKNKSVIDYILQRGGLPYDYTKNPNRKPPAGYHLTFSLAENNDADALQFLENKTGSVAVVFDTKRNKPLPDQFPILGKWFKVIDGDITDYRPNDPAGCIIGLRAKGKAINDKSGFVRSTKQIELMGVA